MKKGSELFQIHLFLYMFSLSEQRQTPCKLVTPAFCLQVSISSRQSPCYCGNTAYNHLIPITCQNGKFLHLLKIKQNKLHTILILSA